MTAAAWLQLCLLIALLAISTPLLGRYLAKVYGGGKAPGDRVFGPVERLIYRACRRRPRQRAALDRRTPLAARVQPRVGAACCTLQLRLQGHLPLNPDHLAGVAPALSFNTAVSFLTNTNWQNYAGESTMSHLTQMAGLAFHNFVSAAAGAAVAVALIRGLVAPAHAHARQLLGRPRRARCTRVLLPLAFVVRARAREPGRRPELPRRPRR